MLGASVGLRLPQRGDRHQSRTMQISYPSSSTISLTVLRRYSAWYWNPETFEILSDEEEAWMGPVEEVGWLWHCGPKIKSSIYSRYYNEACNEWRSPSPPFSAWATQLRRNIAAVASRRQSCLIWPAQESNQRPQAPIAMCLTTAPTGQSTTNISRILNIAAFTNLETHRMSIEYTRDLSMNKLHSPRSTQHKDVSTWKSKRSSQSWNFLQWDISFPTS